jgi:hypothetical protein
MVELIGIEPPTPVPIRFNPPGYSASLRYLVITLLVSGGPANILQGGNSSNEVLGKIPSPCVLKVFSNKIRGRRIYKIRAKYLKSLVGAPGLEPGTR